MHILIATNNAQDFHDEVVRFLESNPAWQDSTVSLVSIVEPSQVSDYTLSTHGETRFRQILAERLVGAEASMDALIRRIPQSVEVTTCLGDLTNVAISAARESHADLMLVALPSPKTDRIVEASTCPVTFLKPRKKTA